jgi:hypothetical protein
MQRAITNVMKNRVIPPPLAACMYVFPILKSQILTLLRVPLADSSRQRFYTLALISASRPFKIFRLSGDVEHGIVSPPGNRDTTEFQKTLLPGRVYQCAAYG